MSDIEDKLAIESDKKLMEKLNQEKVFYSCKVKKKQKKLFSYTQERELIITNEAVYNLKGKDIKRRIKIENLKAVTISDQSDEFIIHGNESEYDYLFVSPDKQKIIRQGGKIRNGHSQPDN